MANSRQLIQIIGPFASEYSLAITNRNLAKALSEVQQEYKISLWLDDNIQALLPSLENFKKYRFLQNLYSVKRQSALVEILGNFPRDEIGDFGVKDLNAPLKLCYLAWEESVFPSKWVREFNHNAHGIFAMSDHVRVVLRNSGIKVPIITVWVGIDIDQYQTENFKLYSSKSFKFLHISSGHYRKGIDVLLQAYFEEFKAEEDVTLVIKHFPNASSILEETMQKFAAHKDQAEVVIINDTNLSNGQMRSIFEQSDCLVAPSRAEGFGLTIAEAMRLKIPIITTGYSGQMDFCHQDNAWLLDFELVASKSHLNIPRSRVAEPSLTDLRQKMRYLFENKNALEVKQKVARAYQDSLRLTWENTATKVYDFIKKAEKFPELKKKKLAVVSTLNSICGIAEYSRGFYSLIESSFTDVRYFANKDASDRTSKDADNVVRTWEYNEVDFEETAKKMIEYQPDFVHIQHHLSFYGLIALGRLGRELKKLNVPLLLTLHAVQVGYVDWNKYKDDLKLFDKIYVHAQADVEFLRDKGIDNVETFVHGIQNFRDDDKTILRKKVALESYSPIIATHGLVHQDKGFLEVIEAVALLKNDYPKIMLLAATATNPNNIGSSATLEVMKKKIAELGLSENIILISDFLDRSEVIKILHCADIIVLAYGDIKEGSSAAVRTCLSAKRPVIVTQAKIFSDLEVGFKIQDNKPEIIAAGIKQLLEDKELYTAELAKVKEFVEEKSWEKVVVEYLGKLSDLV